MRLRPAGAAAGTPILPILSVNFVATLGFSIVLPSLVFIVTRAGGNALVYGLGVSLLPRLRHFRARFSPGARRGPRAQLPDRHARDAVPARLRKTCYAILDRTRGRWICYPRIACQLGVAKELA